MSRSVPITIEVRLASSSSIQHNKVSAQVLSLLERRGQAYTPGLQSWNNDPAFGGHVECIRIAEFGETPRAAPVPPDKALSAPARFAENDAASVPFFDGAPTVHVYQCCEEGPSAERAMSDGDGGDDADVMSNYTAWDLPALSFEGLWESLVFDAAIKAELLGYATSALLFSDAGVNPHLVAWNHVVLLHGPPGEAEARLCCCCLAPLCPPCGTPLCSRRSCCAAGTGKTSLAKALAHKLAVSLSGRFPSAQLIEINGAGPKGGGVTGGGLRHSSHPRLPTRLPPCCCPHACPPAAAAHSLFSKWFSESGKLVTRLFERISELADDGGRGPRG
jgi:hypothetical protein